MLYFSQTVASYTSKSDWTVIFITLIAVENIHWDLLGNRISANTRMHDKLLEIYSLLQRIVCQKLWTGFSFRIMR
jgi:hypothetical protein